MSKPLLGAVFKVASIHEDTIGEGHIEKDRNSMFTAYCSFHTARLLYMLLCIHLIRLQALLCDISSVFNSVLSAASSSGGASQLHNFTASFPLQTTDIHIIQRGLNYPTVFSSCLDNFDNSQRWWCTGSTVTAPYCSQSHQLHALAPVFTFKVWPKSDYWATHSWAYARRQKQPHRQRASTWHPSVHGDWRMMRSTSATDAWHLHSMLYVSCLISSA